MTDIKRTIMKDADCSSGKAMERIAMVCGRIGIASMSEANDEQRELILEHGIANTLPPINGMAVQVTSDSSFDEIRDSGISHQAKTVEHIISFGRCVHALRDKCETRQGGSDFAVKAKEYWGLNKDSASQFLSIGDRAETLDIVSKVLPASYRTIATISRLPSDLLIHYKKSYSPNMTGQQADKIVGVKRRTKPLHPSVIPVHTEDAEIIHESEGNEYRIIDGEAVEVGAKPIKNRTLNKTEAEISGMNGTMEHITDLNMLFKTDLAADDNAQSLIDYGEFYCNKYAFPYVYPPKLGNVEVVISAAENLIDKLARFVEKYKEMK